MRFYISWYPGDPYYPSHDSDCDLLISISSVAKDWTIESFPSLPKHLIIDSGGFRSGNGAKSKIIQKNVFERQLNILADTEIPSIICAYDFPILDPSLSPGNKDHNLHQTIAYAYEFMNLFVQKNLSRHIMPMGIIQGDTPEAIHYCACELKEIGFPIFGLGSLAVLRNTSLILERVVAAASKVDPENLHIFGVNAIQTVFELKKLGIHSVDSSRAAKAAAYNEVFYSKPFRRFGILETGTSAVQGKIPVERRLTRPLPCDCPACLSNPNKILGVGKREYIRLRTLHNYYHLKRTFMDEKSPV